MHSADDRFDLVSVLRQPLSLRHARGTPLTADHKNFVPRQTDPFEQMVIGRFTAPFTCPFSYSRRFRTSMIIAHGFPTYQSSWSAASSVMPAISWSPSPDLTFSPVLYVCRNRRQSPYGTLRRLFLPESQGLLSIFHTHPSRPAPGSADRRMTSHGLSHDCSLCCSSGFCCIRFSRIRFCCTRFCCIHFCCFWS